jgi:tetratricopeptide (TPR) repeat protein
MVRLRAVTVFLGLAVPALWAQAPAAQYVNPKLCATCHREIAEKYSRTGMGRSFFKPAPANTIEPYSQNPEYYHAPSDSHYRMLTRNGEYFQRRWQVGPDGKEMNAEELRIDYVIGSGNHGRFYLHRTDQGLLIELPLAWYPVAPLSKSGGWGLTPGSDLPQPRARTFIAYKCMFCHNAYPQIPQGNAKPGADPVFTGELPEGIDCQRCHGPGSEHVRTSGRSQLVDPAKLSPQGRTELCLQCHLEPASGDIPAKILRFNRGVFSYNAGEPLADFALFFDYAPGRRDDRFEGVGGAYQFRKSRCVIESRGKLECASCHDPHDIQRGAEAVRRYSAVCQQCHAASSHPRTVQATAADCVTCHMPKRRADDAPHMIFTDHRIQRRAPANALAEFPEHTPDPYRGEVVPYYPTSPPPLYCAVAQVGTGNNVAAGMPDLVRLIGELKPKEPEVYMILGDGWKALGKPDEAAAAYRQALELQPDLVRALRAIGDEKSLARAVEIAPEDAQSWFQYGVLTGSADRIRKAIALNPWFRDQYRELAELTRSEADLKEALRSDPFDDAAWDLGGRILAEKGEYGAAFFDFERAIKIRPSGPHLYDYALALVRADRFDEAQAEAERAARADVTMAEAHELLGGLHTRKKELSAAAGEYQAALALKPDLWRVHLRLAMVLASQGDKAAAETHLRAAAAGNDPAVARQALDAVRQLSR